MDELGGGEAVVELDQVEVLGSDAGLLVGLGGGPAGEPSGEINLGAVEPRVAGGGRR